MRSALKSRSSRTSHCGTAVATSRHRAPRFMPPNVPGLYVAPLVSAALLTSGLLSAAPGQAAGTANVRLAEATANADVGPIVSIMKPGYSEQVQGAAQILIAVQSRRYNPQTIEFFVDGISVNGGPAPLTSLPSAAFNWPTDKYPDGPHKLTVRVADTQGFIGQSEVAVYINNNKVHDATPPALAWLSTKPGAELRGTVNIELKAVDNFGVKIVMAVLNPVDKPDQKPAAFAGWLNVPPYIFRLNTTNYPDGVYILKGKAWDSFENEGDSPSILVGISNNQISPTWMRDLQRRIAPNKTTPQPAAPGTPATPQNPADVLPHGPYTTVPKAMDKGVGTGVNTSNPGSASGTGHTQAPDNSNQRVAILPPEAGHGNILRPHTSPYTSLSGSHASSNGTREGALPVSQTSQSAPSHSLQTQVQPCASVPQFPRVRPMNPRSLTTVKAASTVGTAGSYPNIPSPVMTPNSSGDANGEVIAAGPRAVAPANAQGNNAQTSASVSATPPRGVTHQLPEYPALGNLAPRHTAGANHYARGSKPAWTVANNGMGETRISPHLPGTDARRGGLGGQHLASRSAEPDGSLRHTAPATDKSLTRLPADNNSRVAQAGQPMTPATNSAPYAPRLAKVPSFSGTTRNYTPAASVITAAPAPAWMGRESLPVSYVTSRDESLQAIAARYKLPVDVLAAANNLAPTARFAPGAKVRMPQPLQITYAGKPVTGDVASMMVGSTGVTPFRFLFEQQGGTLVWDATHHRVLAHNAAHEVTLAIGSRTATVNNKAVMMDLAAFLCSGRTMVPLRFFEKALHAQVEWEPSSGRLYVAMAN